MTINNRWSEQKAWEWYDSRTWIRGCNYMSADCANRIDQWQALHFDDIIKTTETELELMSGMGYNSIRILLEFIVWKEEHDTFYERFDRFLSVCEKHGISCMVVFGNDCMPPKGEGWKPLKLGEQSYDWGYHGGRKRSQHGALPGVGYHLLDEPELALLHYEWVRETVERYKNDERIIVWDVYNEPGNSNRTAQITLPHLKKFFEIIREINPIQPLTCALWKAAGKFSIDEYDEIERFIVENVDVISYHNYGSYLANIKHIEFLKRQFGRPIFNTEWLGRCLHNTVFEMFPLMFLEKIGCYNWGFVAGKYQTYEPWEGSWKRYYDKPESCDIDFTKWFHDLYRPNHRPYDPRETELITQLCKRADKIFEEK